MGGKLLCHEPTSNVCLITLAELDSTFQNLFDLLMTSPASLKRVKKAIKKGASVEAQFPDAFQKTPLHFAALLGDLSIIELLLEEGAEANAVDMAENTPLHEAAAKASPEVLEALLNAGELRSQVLWFVHCICHKVSFIQ